MSQTTRVLVVGSGGREHAILWALKRTSKVPLDLYCAPGNGGISEIAECVPLSVNDHAGLVEFARSHAIDLTVIGPEGPLAAGIVDEFERHKLKVVGPSRWASRLESSKSFAKDFMRRHNIPTAEYSIANSAAQALEALGSGKFGPPNSPVVVKADGLAAGKGVVVAPSRADAERAVGELASGALVALDAAKQIVIEEALTGREVSILLFADGRNYALMPPARDHKRIGENDTGPNTGGMGAITDTSVVDSEALKLIVREIVEPTLAGADQEGFPFRGILFIGLMLTADGPKVLEYNVRFGDPETQAILVRLKSDLFQIFQAMIEGKLKDVRVDWSDDSSACVVLASAGYPGAYETGAAIKGLASFPLCSALAGEVQVFHAGTSKVDDRFITAGGRVLGITAAAPTLRHALGSCYGAIEEIGWDGMQYRRDIGQFSDRGKTVV
jgi:phosphoribosylamine--glycine ligase